MEFPLAQSPSRATYGGSQYLNPVELTLGSGNDVVRISADDATYRLWVGDATAASAPFSVTKAGILTATSAVITGTVTATSGTIGGFDIGTDYVRDAADSMGMASTVTGGDDVRFWAGDTFANRATADFRVTEAGALTATSATITGGDLTASVINNSAVTTVKLNDSSVTTAKIGDTQVTTAKIGDSQVTTTKLADGSITVAKHGTGLRPIQVVGSLPSLPDSDYPADGSIVFLSTDRKLYRNSTNAEYLSLPGSSGNYASTPDSATVSITGDIDIRVRMAADDWTPVGYVATAVKMDTSTFGLWLLAGSNGKLDFEWSDSGGTTRTAQSTAAVGAVDGTIKWVRVTLDVDNGAAGRDIKFYTSDDYDPITDSGTWAQLGTTVTQAGTTNIRDTTAPVTVGGRTNGTEMLSGKIYYAELRNGIDGTVVAKFDAETFTVGGTSAIATTGETWTINQSGSPTAEIVSDEGPGWTAVVPTTDLTGEIETTQIADLAISTPKLAANAVTAAKITAGTITTTEIASNTIVTGNVAAGAITSDELAANAVIAGKIAAGTIVAADIAASTITAGKLSISTLSAIAADMGTITAGNIRSGGISSSILSTSGSFLNGATAGGESTITLVDTTDFATSGSGQILDSSNDRDAFSWTGKTATTLTGCSGVLSHNDGALVIPLSGKVSLIDGDINEFRFYGDRGDGTIIELVNIGDLSGLSAAALFGSIASGVSIIGIRGYSNSVSGIYGKSVSSNGVQGETTSGIGILGESSSGSGVKGTSTSSFGGEFSGNTTSGNILLNILSGRPSSKTAGSVAMVYTTGGTADNRSATPRLIYADGTDWRLVSDDTVFSG